MLSVQIRRTGLNNDWQRLRRPLCMAASACLHAIVLVAAVALPPLPNSDRRAREVALFPRLDKNNKSPQIIWLRKNDRLPEISPQRGSSRKSLQRQRADGLVLRTDPPNPSHRDQYIRVDQPKTADQKPLQSPNFVLTEAAPAPSKPVLKSFVPPPDRAKAESTSGLGVQEPQLNWSQAARTENLPGPALQELKLPKPAARKFVPPADRAREATRVELFTLDTAPLDAVVDNATTARSSVLPGALNGPQPAPRAFVAPDRKAAGQAGDGLAVPELPLGQGPVAPSGPVSAVVISATPSASTRFEQPEGDRAARIEYGSPPAGSSSSKAVNGGEGLVVPGVTLGGGKGQEGAVMAARASTGPAVPAPGAVTPSVPPSYRPRLDTPSVSIPLRPAGRRVPQQVEAHFRNRIVYCTVLPGPSGLPDWTVWFGESDPSGSAQRTVMRPPSTMRIQLTTSVTKLAESGRVWVTARLGKNGRISSVSLPPGTAPRLASDLASEMLSWHFTPAIRNGEAVEVELVLDARFNR
jgi:hypothetical protein